MFLLQHQTLGQKLNQQHKITMQDMMYCLNPSVLERQKAHLQVTNFFSIDNFFSLQSEHQGFVDGWPSLTPTPQYAPNKREEDQLHVTPASTTTTTTTISNSASSIQAGKEKGASSISKKRKAIKPPMVASEEEEKRMKGGSTENATDKKPDYIHVRARRGQATDSHSLAERVRRERISEKMKYLQGLVPGCSKITGKAGMLDEIINYVQSLQRQVEFLSMKLATVNPRPDFNMEALLTKEMNFLCNPTMSATGMSLEMVDPSFLQFASLQQAAAACGLDMAIAPTSVAGPSLDSCFNVQRPNAGWENDLNSLYGSALAFHSLQGNLLPNNMKTEM